MLLRTVPFQRESSLLREDPERCCSLLDKAADILHACSFPTYGEHRLPYPALSGESNTGWGLRWVLEVFVRRKYELGRLYCSKDYFRFCRSRQAAASIRRTLRPFSALTTASRSSCVPLWSLESCSRLLCISDSAA